MPTSIYKYDGSLLTTVADSTLDTTHATLRFPGKGYQNYGQPVLENLVWIMQHFAGTSAPSLPLAGQCWYDTTSNTIKVYNGVTWDSAGGVTISGSAPITGSSQGELWFDSVNQQLYTWNGTSWSLLGPLGSAINSDPLNKAIPSNSTIDSVRISDGTLNHQVWRITVGGTLLAIISKDAAFTPASAINGFPNINPGINLNTNIAGNGITGATNAFTNNQTNVPESDLTYDLGSVSNRFFNFYTNNGLFSSALAINASIGSYTLEVAGDTYLNGGAVISGSNNIAPIVVQSGNLTLTPALGAIEFDGRDFYVTGNVNNSTSRVSLTAVSKTFGDLTVTNTTPSTSAASGALVVAGGVGLGGNLHVSDTIHYYGNVIPDSSVSNIQLVAPGNNTAIYPGLALGDTRDTGLYTPAVGTVAVTINGSEVLRLNANGSVGIGTNNDRGTAGQVLTTAGTGSAVTWANPTPTGSVIAFAGQTAPAGWLLCQGQAVSRTTYADLFAIINTTYGVGDNSTTFNLPDLRAEFVRGWDAGRGIDIGRVFGSSQGGNIQSHTHSMSYVRGAEAAGTVTDANGFLSLNADTSLGVYTNSNVIVASGGTETRPRNVAMQYIIKI
jgi:microcystin-dependent protein